MEKTRMKGVISGLAFEDNTITIKLDNEDQATDLQDAMHKEKKIQILL